MKDQDSLIRYYPLLMIMIVYDYHYIIIIIGLYIRVKVHGPGEDNTQLPLMYNGGSTGGSMSQWWSSFPMGLIEKMQFI